MGLDIAGLTHIITMDLHQKEIQGFFSFPVDNLRASPFLLQYIQEEVRRRGRAPWPPSALKGFPPGQGSLVKGWAVTFVSLAPA